jgi:predicted O-methyltransferase YrrM
MNGQIARLQVFVRTRAPHAVRMIYRLLRSFSPVRQSQPMPPELAQNCRFLSSRHELLDFLPHGGRSAEVGTYKGHFARQILERTSPRELHLMDLDGSRIEADVLADPRVTLHEGLAHETLRAFPADHYSWVYLDADHSYDGTLRDALAAMDKVEPGGFMVFNDFALIDPWLGRYGVQRAVIDFAAEHRWEFRFVAFHPLGLYDVALQKPAG